MKILVLNDTLKKNAVDYLRLRYIQVSKTDTVKDLKEKIKRTLKDLLEKRLQIEGAEDFTFEKVNLYSIIYGVKKRKREILKLIYSYSENVKRAIQDVSLELPLFDGMVKVYKESLDQGYEQHSKSAMLKVYEKKLGIKLK